MKKLTLFLVSLFTLTSINACSGENTETTDKPSETKTENKMEGMDHSKMNMESKSDNKMNNMEPKSMFEGSKPTETVSVEGVKGEFHIVNIAYANEMLKMADEVYVESMHPHVISEKPGDCPICGMKTEKKKASEAMLDTKGRTHHIDIILKDAKTSEKVMADKAKLKVIGPDNKSFEKDLTLHMGTWETDIDLKDPGKYGMITLVRTGNKDRVYKFYFENARPKTM